MSVELVFIISAPRSGSTLLQSIVSNNKFVNTASEPWLLFHFLNYFNPHLINAKYSNRLAYEATKDFLEKTDFQEYFKEEVGSFIGQVYQRTLGQEGNTKYILDKTPRYYEIVDSIRDVFPTAKIIVLKRNPLAILNSIIDTLNCSGINCLHPCSRDILKAPFLLKKFINKTVNDTNVYVTSYETIIEKPLKEASKIYSWLGIEFKDEYLDYSKNKKFRGKYGDPKSIYRDNQPVQKSEIWKKKLVDPYWKSFFAGYIHYLGNDFFQSYRYPIEDLKGKPSRIFDSFRYVTDQKIPERPPVNDYLRHIYYRSMYKLYSK